MSSVTFVIGGARSGKSRFAETLTRGFPARRHVYVATAEIFDDEMAERVAAHRAGRKGRGWQTVEAPYDLPSAITANADADSAVLVDCLTLWLSNRMLAGADLAADRAALAASLAATAGPVVLVANEVGLSIVPDNALARRFRDEAG